MSVDITNRDLLYPFPAWYTGLISLDFQFGIMWITPTPTLILHSERANFLGYKSPCHSFTLDFNAHSQIGNITCKVQAKLNLKGKVKFTQLPIGRKNNSEPTDLPDGADVNVSQAKKFSPQQEQKPHD